MGEPYWWNAISARDVNMIKHAVVFYPIIIKYRNWWIKNL